MDLSHLGRKGLHMTPHGTGKLAINIIRKLKGLEQLSRVASSYSDETAANVHDVCTSKIGDNDSLLYTTSNFPRLMGYITVKLSLQRSRLGS